jgi:hypothetical protein
MWSRPKKAVVVSVVAPGVAFDAALLVRAERANPPTDPSRTLQTQVGAASRLAAVTDRSCGNCRSNATTWRWYARVAPLSWIMARAVSEGRRPVNFSEWGTYSPAQQRALLVASCGDAINGTMPMRADTRLRPEAQLSPQDVETICAASRQPEPDAASNAEPRARRAR